ncbi:MAG: UDP-N-acetylmuramoyl-tripeptide--D-alanyl-D-alanine ligase [Salibacteraceae bacterium]
MNEQIYNAYKRSAGVCTDTRKLKENQLFFALSGPNFNGNDFIEKALREGCRLAIADEERAEFEGNDRVLVVEDSLIALQLLANAHRRKLKIPIIALTGSNGKTTTKELMHAALSQQYETYATKGNLNNHIGVPLSLLEINSNHEIAIIEMGANHQLEIAQLCTIAEPEFGLITNIGMAHLEGFDGEEGVYLGKKELFDHIIENEGKLFLNLDDPKILRAAGENAGTTYGQSEDCVYCGEPSLVDDRLTVSWKRSDEEENNVIHTQLSGLYNFSNVMAAIAVARYFGIDSKKINRAIASYTPDNHRSQIEKSERGNTLIIDCYNANPSSMNAAIENLGKLTEGKTIAILGDMFELGDQTEIAHNTTVKQLNKHGIAQSILIGNAFSSTSEAHPNSVKFNTTEEAAGYLKDNTPQNATILIKGSRSMKLEQLLELL